MIRASLDRPDRFGVIFERHFDTIHRYLARRAGATLADDLAAQTFTEAFARRNRYDTRWSSARPWLYGIATNLLRRHRRLERRQLQAYAREGIDPIVETDLDAVLNRVDAHSARARLAGALAALKPPDRDTLLLYAWADLSYAEVALALCVPVGTVRSRIHRARSVTRAQLGLTDEQLDATGALPRPEEA